MDENNVVTQELPSVDEMSNDELKNAVEAQLQRVRRQNLLMGAQSICRVVLEKIYACQAKPSKTTYRDYERLVKDIQSFCETGLLRTLSNEGEIVPKEAEAASE